MGGSPLDKDRYWQLKREKVAWPEILRQSGLDTHFAADFLDKFIDRIEKPEYLKIDSVIPGAQGALEEIARKHESYLVSLRRNPENLGQEVSDLGLSKYFKKILTGHSETDGSDKKHELVSSELNGEKALIVGDTEADVKAGKLLGLTTVAVLSGIRSDEFLKPLHPDFIIKNVNELPELLLELTR